MRLNEHRKDLEEINAYLGRNFSQASGGWKSRVGLLQGMLARRIGELEALEQRMQPEPLLVRWARFVHKVIQ